MKFKELLAALFDHGNWCSQVPVSMLNSAEDHKVEVIAPNFKQRHSGVTSTIIRLLPHQAKEIGIFSFGPGLPESLPKISFFQALTLRRRRQCKNASTQWRVWHARRNVEMLGGLFFKNILRKKLKLLFTSAAQRKHSQYTKLLIDQMDDVIATSQKSASYLERDANIVLHGVDTSTFEPAQDKKALRQALGLEDDDTDIPPVLIGCFGRVRAQKGTDLFVDAMIHLALKYPQVKGIILGRTTEKHKAFHTGLEEKIRKNGLEERIVFLGEVSVEELPRYFAALDIFIAPQRWEGFGLTPLEAMSSGVPVIATKVGAFEEIIEDNKTGFIIDIEDLENMISKADELITDLSKREQFSISARQHCLDRFMIEHEAGAIIAIYRKLLEERSI